MAAVVALIAPAARAATAPVPNNFTWSGTDSAAGVNDKWSDPGNWQGGAAPTQGEPVNPVFPPLHCTATGPCGNARARAFYDRQGFRPTGRSRPFPGAAGRSITEMRPDPAP